MSKLFNLVFVLSISLLPSLVLAQESALPNQEVEFEIIELEGECAVVDGKLPTDPRCYQISEYANLPQVYIPVMAVGSILPPKVEERSQALGRGSSSTGMPGMKEAKEIMNAIDWFWRFLEKNAAGLKVNTKGSANAIPSDPTCQAWDAMGNWNPTPKAIPYILTAKNGFGMEVIRLEYSIQFTYGGDCRGKGKYLDNVRLVYGHAASSLFFTVEVDVEIGDIVNFGTSEQPIAGLQIMAHNRMRSLVKNISESNAYYVRGDGQFSEVMPHRALGDMPNALLQNQSSPLVGQGYELLDVAK